MKILMLAPHMSRGYGVAEAVAMQVRSLRPLGIDAVVGCLTSDGVYPDLTVRRVGPDPASVRTAAALHGASVIIAHGSPFFETLPALTGGFRTIAYEYGDPTPELFGHDAAERRRIVEHKRAEVYPHVDAVASISEFVRHDIGWPDTSVIRLGVDHVPDRGGKPLLPPRGDRALRVGTLMRLGTGEARYKGHSELLDLHALLSGSGITFEIMGRGEPGDAAAFERVGFRAHLNATDEQRTEYLRGLDVLVSPSLWEGMNLPIGEAAALGTPALAFDTGAHPEFTPFVFDSIRAMAAQLEAYAADPALVLRHGELHRRYVRTHFAWRTTASELASLIYDRWEGPPAIDDSMTEPGRTRVHRFARAIRTVGVKETGRYYLRRFHARE